MVFGYIPIKGRTLLVLIGAGVSIAIACAIIAGPSPESQVQPVHVQSVQSPAVKQCIADAQAEITRIDAIDPHCPAFLDAPIGNKPCPLAEALAARRNKAVYRKLLECQRVGGKQ